MLRSTYSTLTVAETKQQFVTPEEQQIAAGIKFSGQYQMKYCVSRCLVCLWRRHDTVDRFMAENADEFGREIEFVFERRVSVP